MKLNEAIAIRVQMLLKARNFTQYYLYKNGGIPRSTISDVVNTKKKRVSTETIYQICSTLNMSLSEFYNHPIFDDLED